jgi:hypothetical protein
MQSLIMPVSGERPSSGTEGPAGGLHWPLRMRAMVRLDTPVAAMISARLAPWSVRTITVR